MGKMRRSGQSLAEYGIIITLVAIVGLAGLMLLGQGIHREFLALMGGQSIGTSASQPALQPQTTTVSSFATQQNTNQPTQEAVSSPMQQTVLSTPPATPQVSGSLGGNETVYANADATLDFAAKFQSTDPAVYNVLVKLGMKGKEMAQAIASGDTMKTSFTWDKFTDIWIFEVYESGIYNQLSPADQKYILSLTNQSQVLAANYVGGVSMGATAGLDAVGGGSTNTSTSTITTANGTSTTTTNSNIQPGTTSSTVNPADTASQIDGNSTETINCGVNEGC